MKQHSDVCEMLSLEVKYCAKFRSITADQVQGSHSKEIVSQLRVQKHFLQVPSLEVFALDIFSTIFRTRSRKIEMISRSRTAFLYLNTKYGKFQVDL